MEVYAFVLIQIHKIVVTIDERATLYQFLSFDVDCSIDGQVYQQSRTCPKTCSNPDVFCDGNVPGCGCPPGQIIDEDRNRCVHPINCPSMVL